MARQKFKAYTLDVSEFDIEIPRKNKKAAMEEVSEYLAEELRSRYAAGNSPVSGGIWKRKLTKEYAAKKEGVTGVDIADLELTGEMLESLTVKPRGSKIKIDVAKDQYAKAEGHITGQYGKNKMKKDYRREFLPQGGDSFKRDILGNIKKILRDHEE